MVKLSLYYEDVQKNGELLSVYEFNICYKITIVSGDSGTGKSYFVDRLLDATQEKNRAWTYKCDTKVIVIDSIEALKSVLKDNTNTVIVIDEDIVTSMLSSGLMGKVLKSKNYFLIFDRDLESSIETNVDALLKVEPTDEVYGSVQRRRVLSYLGCGTNRNMDKANKMTHFVTEDEISGLTFWKEVLSKLDVVDTGKYGSGQVLNNIKYTQEKYEDAYVLVALDYDFGSSILKQILEDKSIDKKRLSFIPLESFEEVICNSEFILSKFPDIRDIVINYRNYLDCSYKSTGKYFSTVLSSYVKVKSPVKSDGDSNIYKFYEKNMKNFTECFIKDCCDFNLNECKLYYDGDKKKAMLSNKFEFLRQYL